MDWLELFKAGGDHPLTMKVTILMAIVHVMRETTKMRASVETMGLSLSALQISLAVIANEVQSHEKRIDHLESKL